jgi:hypothetical protein
VSIPIDDAPPSFEVCHQGRCTFAGCEDDVECRVILGLFETNGSVRAECR